ncbi:MAG: hypothetical protein HND48_01285 [Chloroflexi bacterium]|jgi:uncharacterized protein YfaS (alpha-2-macroglobulin family)|nr:hypothetical protein [Chloroflexota bacterium]OQY87054.1 MAG: hypothetical protein B6D42_00005 [Anaerolineae bacterium UTCFX5]GIK29978.1 MAG: hypothetical protein BroJett007_31160 [Chloroflexota bacterium]
MEGRDAAFTILAHNARSPRDSRYGWIQPGVPRFLVEGDRVQLTAAIHNGTDTVQQATVALDADDPEVSSETTQQVTIGAGGQARV